MAYEFRITVRGYELDSFGHVNNAVYYNYCEQARWEIFRSRDLFDFFKDNRLFLVVVDAHIRYVKESRIFDELIIRTNMTHQRPYLVFEHAIENGTTGDRIARATVKTLLVDNERIPHDVPDHFIE